ncbi:MAG: hypothetical protein Q4E13_13775 [Clostridia bacterium]|nr:hypothetical protein [Clostridia bacterium]
MERTSVFRRMAAVALALTLLTGAAAQAEPYQAEMGDVKFDLEYEVPTVEALPDLSFTPVNYRENGEAIAERLWVGEIPAPKEDDDDSIYYTGQRQELTCMSDGSVLFYTEPAYYIEKTWLFTVTARQTTEGAELSWMTREQAGEAALELLKETFGLDGMEVRSVVGMDVALYTELFAEPSTDRDWVQDDLAYLVYARGEWKGIPFFAGNLQFRFHSEQPFLLTGPAAVVLLMEDGVRGMILERGFEFEEAGEAAKLISMEEAAKLLADRKNSDEYDQKQTVWSAELCYSVLPEEGRAHPYWCFTSELDGSHFFFYEFVDAVTGQTVVLE